ADARTLIDDGRAVHVVVGAEGDVAAGVQVAAALDEGVEIRDQPRLAARLCHAAERAAGDAERIDVREASRRRGDRGVVRFDVGAAADRGLDHRLHDRAAKVERAGYRA